MRPPPPYSMLQNIGRVATPKFVPRNCLRYLQTTLIMGTGGLAEINPPVPMINLCEVLRVLLLREEENQSFEMFRTPQYSS